MRVLCGKTKLKRLVFHSPELVKTLCAGVCHVQQKRLDSSSLEKKQEFKSTRLVIVV